MRIVTEKDKSHSIWLNILTSRTYDQFGLVKRSRIIFSNIIMISGVFVLTLFTLLSFSQGLVPLGSATGTTCLFYIFLIFWARRSRQFEIVNILVVSTVFILYVYLLYSGGNENTGLLWLFSFPLIAHFLLDVKKGTILNILLWLTIAVCLNVPVLDKAGFSTIYGIRIMGIYFFIWIFSFSYQYTMVAVQKRLSETTNALTQEKRQTDSIMNNVDQGIFLLDENLRIGKTSSVFFRTLFEGYETEDRPIMDLLKIFLSDKDLNATSDYLEMYFSDAVNPDLLKDINPLDEMNFNFLKEGSSEERILRFGFSTIKTSENKQAILGMVQDITEEKKLQDQLKQEEIAYSKSMEHLFQIIHIRPALLTEYLNDSQKELETINRLLKDQQDDKKALLQDIYASLHTIKGNGVLLGLKQLGEEVHKIELIIKQHLNKDYIIWNDVLDMTLAIGDFQKEMDDMRELVEKISRFQLDSVDKGNVSLAGKLKEMLKNEAETKQICVALNTEDFDESLIPEELKTGISNIMAQMVRNSLSHGIEDQQTRIEKQKAEEGLISIGSRLEKKNLLISFKDDGQGIRPKKIRQKAVERKMFTAQEAEKLSISELVKLIFHPGFSTKESSDLSSGQGIGMHSIRKIINSADGKISIRTKPGNYTEFIISFPV